MNEYGTLDKSYLIGRRTKKSLIYRLNRRAKEVIKSIKKYYSGIPKDIIDLGTAEGLMLGMIKDNFPSAKCIGIEYSWELLKANANSEITVLQGDVNYLPLPNNSFDIAVATAIIEHLPSPKKLLEEVKRVLKPTGLIILTSPDPFWEWVATLVGHLPNEQHKRIMNLRELIWLFHEVGYEILGQKKFMLSPVGLPLEIPIENVVRSIGLNFLFVNNLVVGKKIEH